jgi:WD40 repeat protein
LGTVLIWNTADRKQISKLTCPALKRGADSNFALIAVSPDGKTFAVSLPDKSTRILDATGRELRRLSTAEQAQTMAFSRDGKTLFTGHWAIESWKVDNAEKIGIVKKPQDPVWALCVSPDGKYAAYQGYSNDRKRLRLAEVSTGKIVFECDIPGAAKNPNRKIATDDEIFESDGLRFSPRGGLLAVAPGDHTVAFWDVSQLMKSEKPFASPANTVLKCGSKVRSFAFSPDGARLATIEEDDIVRIYEIATKKITVSVKRSGCKNYAVKFSPDGKTLAITGEIKNEGGKSQRRHCFSLCDSVTGKERSIEGGLLDSAHTIVFHPNGRSLATIHLPAKALNDKCEAPADYLERIGLWDHGFTREKRLFEDPVQLENAKSQKANGEASWISACHQEVSAAFSPDGWTFAALDDEMEETVIYETASGLPRMRLKGHLQTVSAIAYTPDGRSLITTSFDSTLLLWDVTGQRTGTRISGSSDQLYGLLASSDAEKAGRAMSALLAKPADALAELRKHLKPVSIQQDLLDKLVSNLDDRQFAVREKATKELAAMGPIAETALRKGLNAKPSLETATRIEKLLAGFQSKPNQLNRLREIRAVEVLERIGSREALHLLGELAEGADQATLTMFAKESRDRLHRRLAKPTNK